MVLDKPLGVTSTQAVGKVRWLFDANKAGHGGTLDPLATGILPIALGEATKTVSYAMDGKKTYRFTVAWGEERSTDDLEGSVTKQSPERPSYKSIEPILSDFIGEIQQVPPAFSAIKVEGERSYDLARAGAAPDLAARPVLIEELKLVEPPDPDHAIFEVTCGKGTYVRSLARDMGRKLGCFGHVSALRRIRLGPFSETDAIPLERLEEMRHKPPGGNAMDGFLRPIATVLDGIPALALDEAQTQRLRLGQSVLLRGAKAPIASDAVLVTLGQKPIGICSIEQGSLKPKRLFNL
ncbi:MAG: tRNA pseudouridine(55) synthase TruB [Rhizobiales bacterium]|nr:tRNA pseudouridine(55) synthase TruB [Hyphomicrobiales bacterium]